MRPIGSVGLKGNVRLRISFLLGGGENPADPFVRSGLSSAKDEALCVYELVVLPPGQSRN